MNADQLADIEARIQDCQTYKFGLRNGDKLAHEDAPALLALVREQAAQIKAVRDLAASTPNFTYSGGTASGIVVAHDVLAALEPTL